MSQLRRCLNGWLELLRPPNLFTVPGDPLMGALLAGGAGAALTPAFLTGLAATVLYIAGLLWNDCADASEDTRTRPERPIPSGRVSRKSAMTVATLLAITGISLSWSIAPLTGILSILLTCLVLVYDFVARRYALAEFITMGLCRGTSVLLGASTVERISPENPLPWVAAGGITLYIIAVSILAHGETCRRHLGIKPWLPATVAGMLFVAMGRSTPIAGGLAMITMGWLCVMGLKLRGEPDPVTVQRSIGGLIRTLLLIQAACCALIPDVGLPAAIVLLIGWPVATLTGRWFYGS